jgi:hypothetical protein
MKLNQILNAARSIRALALCAMALLGIAAAPAANFFDDNVSGIDLGNASGGANLSGNGHRQWAIFALSGGVTITDTSVDGSYDVLGNVGAAGAGGLTLSLSRIQGSVFRDTGSYANSGGVVTGTNTGGNGAYLNTAVGNANSASSAAQGLTASTSGLTLGGGVSGSVYGSNYTAALSLNNTAGSITATSAGTKVLNLTDLILSGTGAILTLNGNGVAGAVNYVINVNRYLTLGTAAQIQLGGGLTPQNVLFNVKSNVTQYDVTLSGGSVLNGILLAPTRTVKLTGASTVNGEVIASGVSLSGRSKVINPTVSQ